MNPISPPVEKQSDSYNRITKFARDLYDYLSFRSIREKKELIKLFERETGHYVGNILFDVYFHGFVRAGSLLTAGSSAGLHLLDPDVPLRLTLTAVGVNAIYFGADYVISQLMSLDNLTQRLYESSKRFRSTSSPSNVGQTYHIPYEETVPGIGSKTLSAEDARKILGVNRHSTYRDIRSVYRKIALKTHPDRNPGDPVSAEKFKRASEAYGVLTEVYKRNHRK